jgi:hypothetical protein
VVDPATEECDEGTASNSTGARGCQTDCTVHVTCGTGTNPNWGVFSGTADNSTDNSTALSAAFAQSSAVCIPAGANYYKIAGKVEVPAGKTVLFEDGARLDVSGHLNGSATAIVAGPHEILSTTSQVDGTWATGIVRSEWTGAVGDGTTDDYASLVLFFHLAVITDHVEAQLGVTKDYYTSKTIFQKATGAITLNGRGSKLERRYADLKATEQILYISGVAAKTTTVTADLVAGATTMQVADVTGLTPGMGIELKSSELYGKEDMGQGNWHLHYKGLLSKIASVSGTTVTMTDPIPYAFGAASITSAMFFNIYPVTVKNLNFASMNIVGKNQMTQLTMRDLFRVVVDNVVCDPLGYSCLSANGIYDGHFSNIKAIAPAKGGDDYTFAVYGVIPSLNVNSTYEKIYGRARTHGIAFSGSPSYNVVVRNSDFKAENGSSNGGDSHASHWVRFENSTIYGFQGNWGTFQFDNCKMYDHLDSRSDFNEREGASRGGPDVTFTNCDFYATADASSPRTIIYRYDNDPDSTMTGKYTIRDSRFHLENAITYLIRAASPGPATNIRPFTVENNEFTGSGTLYLPKSLSNVPTTKGGVFSFKNNRYSKVKWSSPPLDQFQTTDVVGNTPVSTTASDFVIDWSAKHGNVNLRDNTFVGTCLSIKNCLGEIVFDNNDFFNDLPAKSTNSLTNNPKLDFTNNRLHGTPWTRTGNGLDTGNL